MSAHHPVFGAGKAMPAATRNRPTGVFTQAEWNVIRDALVLVLDALGDAAVAQLAMQLADQPCHLNKAGRASDRTPRAALTTTILQGRSSWL